MAWNLQSWSGELLREGGDSGLPRLYNNLCSHRLMITMTRCSDFARKLGNLESYTKLPRFYLFFFLIMWCVCTCVCMRVSAVSFRVQRLQIPWSWGYRWL